MNKGKQISEMSLKATSMSVSTGPGNGTAITVHFEGPSPHYGTIVRSATFSAAGANQGSYTTAAVGYLSDGNVVTGSAQGTYVSSGVHRWRTAETFTFADGSQAVFEGDLNFAERSWTGKIYERA